ncbi:hypothetical protein BGZ97_000428 [Linnemannia gamsii]|uniref:Uncharacterized protein n=1 Tax=Linnemannia gamsii TaxID=64522 RepID=A0A9P6QYA1_9FUNG|nr:hypothetical protein BGZ97_000428 [Linnemannia gamsii]
MGQELDLIPPISTDLTAIKDGLQIQLQGLEELLVQRNLFIFKQTTQKYNKLLGKFLLNLQQYVDSTLVDLFRFIEDLSLLMMIYDKGLEEFTARAASTSQRIESSLIQLQAMIDQHSNTLSALSKTAIEMSDLTQEYALEAKDHSKGALHAKLASTGLAITGFAASACLAVLAPVAAISTLFVVAGGGGGISGAISLFDSHKSDIYVDATTKLNQLQKCNNDFKTPIGNICAKLGDSKVSLRHLKEESKLAGEDNNDWRAESYATAKQEAENIKKQCNEIQTIAVAILDLKGKITYRVGQIPTDSTLLSSMSASDS